MKYKVTETYTPDDIDNDRDRSTNTFETDSTDILEIATLAFIAVKDRPGPWQLKTADERLEFAKKRLEEEDIVGQIADIEADETGGSEGFSFLLFSNNGEYDYTIEQV